MEKNMRQAYGEALVALGQEDERIVALDADLSKSTMSLLFAQKYPERFFEMGIAEANMISTAAGLALSGCIPFASTFAVFASGRPYDQIRSSVCIPRLNVNICGSSAGLSDFGDGKTHQSVDDIALMRALPGMTVFSPADAVETAKIMRCAASLPGPCYLRVNRNPVPVVTDAAAPFAFGKASCLRDGHDAVIFGTGYMVALALEAARLLGEEGVSVRVVNISTIKPLDAEGVCRLAAGLKVAVTVEEASIIGGLGSAVCEALMMGPQASRIPLLRMGIEDTFGTSAQNYDELLDAYGLTPRHIAQKVRQALALT